MTKIKPRTLSGFMELLPPRQMLMEKMLHTLRETFALYGFTPLDTPVIEAAEVLLAKGGGETEKQIYRVDKADQALRFDLTVPLAKYVALNYGQLAFPFRRYQIGKVYRGERTQKGRFREFYQADIDIIGDGSLAIMNDAEIPAIIYRAFTALGLKRFKIRVNNRKILNGFFEILGVSSLSADIMRTADKLDKIGRDKVAAELALLGLPPDGVTSILDFMSATGSRDEMLDSLEPYMGKSAVFDEGVSELREVTRYLPEFGAPEENFGIDFTIARGLDYYTGTVYETTMLDSPDVGSICSGGRYDDLAGYYTDKKLPGVGISIGLTRLFHVLGELGLLDDDALTAPADVLIIPMTDDLSAVFSAATTLRSAGIRTLIYGEDKKLKAKFNYADKLGIPYAVFIGDDEIRSGVVTLKDQKTGEQVQGNAEYAAARVKNGLSEKASEKPIKDTGCQGDKL